MSKKIGKNELRRLIIAEARAMNKPKVKRVSPKAKRRIMEAKKRQRLLEARTEIAHIELLEEGLFDSIKAMFKAGATVFGDSGKEIGQGISKMANSAAETAKGYAKAIGDMADEKVKSVAQEYHKNMADSMGSVIASKSKEMLQALIKGGYSEDDAKQLVATAVNAAMAQAMVAAGK